MDELSPYDLNDISSLRQQLKQRRMAFQYSRIERRDAEIARLRAINAELVAACEAALEDGQVYKLSEMVKRQLRTTLVKAKADGA